MSVQQNISIIVNENTYLKSPESSELGRKIVQASIELMEELGFENFTFKKVANHIQSTEASIYRYFESKHQLLAYLVLWYWGWQEYRLILKLTNVDDPKERLKRAIKLLTETIEQDSSFSQINEVKLHNIVVSESSKVFLNKNVERDNALGFFNGYKKVVEILSQIILEINPNYLYSHMLCSTMIEGSHHQRFFALHLPKLTDEVQGKDTVTLFYTELVFKSIEA